jgi:acyl transferase domain-containing protein
LEITSFLASLSKVCSIFQTNLVPPNVNLNTLNPKIKWNEYQLKVATEVTPIRPRNPSKRLLVSMNSSGIGGSNVHVVLESFPNPPCETPADKLPVLVVAGGLSSRSAGLVAEKLADILPTCDSPSQISAAYGRRSSQTTWRSYTIFNPHSPTVEFSPPRFISRKRPPLVFVMSGQGPQHLNSTYLLILTCLH